MKRTVCMRFWAFWALALTMLTGCDSDGSGSSPVYYTVGFTVNGLAGTLILSNNGGDDVSASSNGIFVFTRLISHGGSYSVSIAAQPVGQICTVTNGTGIATGNVSNISVVCPAVTYSQPLNDTGQDWCANFNTNFIDCLWIGVFPGQDAFYGRDAKARAGTLTKTGGGHAGFDFTKLGANGQPLSIQNAIWSVIGSEFSGTTWSCVQDNHTRLVWEVKLNDAGSLHSKDHTYTWYSTDAGNNGGFAGYANGGSCVGSSCDTQAFVAAVNAQGWCGANDWRLPTVRELESIVDMSRYKPAIDRNYFANTHEREGDRYWSSSPDANSSDSAWYVHFRNGEANYYSKSGTYRIRLVRAGQ